MERFACSYCEIEQIVERSGGAAWLSKVETAIRAVQQGTDRTAAELALVRLGRELVQAREKKAALIRAADDKLAKARASRNGGFLLSFAAACIFVPFILRPLKSFSEEIFWLVCAVACAAVPLTIEKSNKLPAIDIQHDKAEIDAQIARIEEHIEHNRAILDAAPTR